MADNMSIAGRGSRVAPATGGHKTLQIGPAKAPHPRRPGVAESVERHPITADRAERSCCSPRLRPLNGRQTARGDLGIEKQKIPMAALVKSEHASSGLYAGHRAASASGSADRSRVVILRCLDIGFRALELTCFPFQRQRLADAAAGIEQEGQQPAHFLDRSHRPRLNDGEGVVRQQELGHLLALVALRPLRTVISTPA